MKDWRLFLCKDKVKMIRVGIFGASGYTGFELVTILQRHAEVQILFTTANSSADKTLDQLHPAMPPLKLIRGEEADLSQIDLAFLCLPHVASAETAIRCLQAGVRVIDLSADFRLRSAQDYAQWYGHIHPAPELLAEAVYGLTEFVRPQLPTARLVANPGCYPTSVILGAAPLVRAGAVMGTIIADSKSGVSGAGRNPQQHTHFVEVADNFAPYKIGRTHRHYPEIKEQIAKLHPTAPDLFFSPHLLPVPRGILSTLYLPTDLPFADVRVLYESAYEGEPFVRVLANGQYASLAHVVHTNRCVISLHSAEKMVIAVAAEDNLIKGASGQAVQNMNVMFGLPETMGLF